MDNSYNNMLSIIPNPAYCFFKNNLTIAFNKKFIKILENPWPTHKNPLSYDQLLTLTSWTSEQVERYKQDELNVILTGVIQENFEIPPLLFKNKTCYFIVNRTPLINSEQEIIGTLNIFTDITSTKQELFYLKNVLNKIPGSIYWKDKNGVYLGCNEFVLNMAGQKNIVGKTDFDMPWKEYAPNLKKIEEEIVKSNKIVELEEHPILSDRRQITMLTHKAPLVDEQEHIVGIIGVSIDITELKNAQLALINAKERAEAANLAKVDFIHNMQHDLGTPFSGIHGSAQVLYAMYANQYPELNEWLEPMMASCTQWEKVHHHILEVIRTEQEPIRIEKFYIYDELINVHGMLTALLHLKKLACFLPSREELEPLGLLEADRLKFNLILLSLLSNAINFTDQGYVKVVLSCHNDSLIIEVSDTGIGIPGDKLEFIFEQFTKLEASNKYASNFKGIGTGLYISRRHAENMGGTLTVASELGKGSTFTLSLPFCRSATN